MDPVIILMYHRIAEPPMNVRIRGLYVTPRQFDCQIGWLKKKRADFLTFGQLTGEERRPRSSHHRFKVIITFDDGHLDNYTHAFPILQHHNVPAVIYPVVDDLGKKDVIWPESVDPHPVNLLNPRQIKEMAQNGIEFGSHLMHHTHLTQLPMDRQRWELETSKVMLEAILQKHVISVAYPYGDHDEKVAHTAQRVGYRFGLTTVPGIADMANNRLTLKRQAIKGSKFYHPLKFRRKLQRLLARLPS